MMKVLPSIVKKELLRFGTDKRMLIAILMPGIIIYIMYSLLGISIEQKNRQLEEYRYQVQCYNLPESMQQISTFLAIDLLHIDEEQIIEVKDEVEQQNIDLLLVFPNDFDTELEENEDGKSSEVPEIKLYYNSTSNKSMSAFQIIQTYLLQYETSKVNLFDMNIDLAERYDLATEQDTMGSIFSMMLPMFLMIFLFNGCLTVASESIAGEKERGTLATLLVTPMDRKWLAIGKIISISLIGLISGISSFVGIIFSLPKMVKGVYRYTEINTKIYLSKELFILFLIIVSTVLVIVGMISIISGIAKSVKEAGVMTMPFMALIMILSAGSLLGGEPASKLIYYFIPFYNSVQCMAAIFSFEIWGAAIITTILMNAFYTCVMIFILTKIFNSEKIIYN